jgi:CheY-like chemotaxis protein
MIRAFLVDDEPAVVEWMASHLRNERPELSLATFTDPRAALDSIKQRCPDILITDLRMPGLSGLDLIVAARDVTPTLPVIVTTGDSCDQLKSELRRSRSIQVLEKPFDLRRLSEAVSLSVDFRAGFSGAIELPMLPDLIQLCAISQVTGRLGIHGARRRGDLYLQEGEVVHAACGEAIGAEAVFEILGWVGGRFSMERGVPAPQRSISASWQELLLEGYRQLDEARERGGREAEVEPPLEP